jgi:hypothetical protein
MRANVNLDTDAYAFASAYAGAKGIPLGAAISELLRKAEHMPEPSVAESPRLTRDKRGLLVVKASGRMITSKMVKDESEDDLG